ncbi:hypothetical protein Emag_005929 [Eimeria magna]
MLHAAPKKARTALKGAERRGPRGAPRQLQQTAQQQRSIFEKEELILWLSRRLHCGAPLKRGGPCAGRWRGPLLEAGPLSQGAAFEVPPTDPEQLHEAPSYLSSDSSSSSSSSSDSNSSSSSGSSSSDSNSSSSISLPQQQAAADDATQGAATQQQQQQQQQWQQQQQRTLRVFAAEESELSVVDERAFVVKAET